MKRFLSVLLTMLAVSAFFVSPVFALSQTTPPTPLDVILSIFLQFAQLAGVGATISAIVNVLKALKVVSDGTAGKWVAGFNLIAIAGLIYLKLFQPQIAIEFIDAQAAVFAQILLLVLGYVVQLGSGMFAHGVFANLRIPGVGYSFSRK